MTVLTDFANAQIRDRVAALDGEILTRPALVHTDGAALSYACDVRVSSEDSRGLSYWRPLPGHEGDDPPEDDGERLALDPLLSTGRVLYGVPIAAAGHELSYAEPGAAVKLARNTSGRWEITGFSKRKPGKLIRVAVNLATMAVATPVDATITSRALTFGELGDVTIGGGFGVCAFGAYGVWSGGVLVAVRV